MSFDPSMNIGYMPAWLATNSFVQQVGGLWQGTMTTALAAALLTRHKGPARHTTAAQVGAGYVPTVANLVMTSGGRIIAGDADLAAIANGNANNVKTYIRVTDPEAVAA
jgi:hypothetical protein